MKKNLKQTMVKLVVKSSLMAVALIAFLPAIVFADGPGFGGGVNDGGACDAPLDGGLGLLAAAGIGYGIKKFADAKAKRQHAGK